MNGAGNPIVCYAIGSLTGIEGQRDANPVGAHMCNQHLTSIFLAHIANLVDAHAGYE